MGTHFWAQRPSNTILTMGAAATVVFAILIYAAVPAGAATTEQSFVGVADLNDFLANIRVPDMSSWLSESVKAICGYKGEAAGLEMTGAAGYLNARSDEDYYLPLNYLQELIITGPDSLRWRAIRELCVDMCRKSMPTGGPSVGCLSVSLP